MSDLTSARRIYRRPSFLAVFFMLAIAGCGLAMNSEDRLNRATESFENGDLRAAIIDTKDVLLGEPDNVRGRLLLGRLSVAIGDGAGAEKEFRRAIELGTPFDEVAIGLARALLQQRKFSELFGEVSIDVAAAAEDRAALALMYGQAYLGLQQPADARKYFSSVLQFDPDSVEAKLGIVASHEAAGNFVQARSGLDDIVTAHPDDVRGWLASGELHFQLRNPAAAEANFNVALRLAEDQSDNRALLRSLAGLADALFAQSKNEHARAIVDRLVSVAPNHPQALVLEARVAYLDKNWPKAQQALQQVLQVSPDHIAAKMMLGAVHIESGNLSQAEMYLSSVVAASPENVEARRLLAEARLLQQKLDEAQEALRPMITGSNEDVVSLSMAARASAGLGDFDTAIGYLERSLEASPGNQELQFQLVTTYLSAGRNKDAERFLDGMESGDAFEDEFRREALLVLARMRDNNLEVALESAKKITVTWPESAMAFNLLGSVQLQLPNRTGARSSFETAAELSSNGPVSHRYLATLEEAEGNFDAARSHLLAILDAQPELPWAMFSLARLSARDNDLTAAAEWLEKVREKDKSTVGPRAILAQIYLGQGNVQDAEEVIDEALALDGDDAKLHNLLGGILLQAGQYRRAASSFQQALAIDQENLDYRLNLARSQKQSGDDAEAMQTLEGAMDDSLSYMPSAVLKVSMLVDAGELNEAFDIVRRLQELYPDSPVPDVLAGEIYVRQGDLLAASNAYDKALSKGVTRASALRSFVIKNQLGLADAQRPLEMFLAQKPLDSNLRMALAGYFGEQNDPLRSITEYEKVLEAEPDNAVALNNLAWVLFTQNDSRAEDTASKAYALLPQHESVVDTLGWILVNSGSVDEGVVLLRKAVKLSGGRAEVRYHLAAGLSKAGHVDEARDLLDEILSTGEAFESSDAASRLREQL